MEVTWDAGSGLTQLMQPERSLGAWHTSAWIHGGAPAEPISPWFSCLADEQHVSVGWVWLLQWPRKAAPPRCSRTEEKAVVADPGPDSEGAACRVATV